METTYIYDIDHDAWFEHETTVPPDNTGTFMKHRDMLIYPAAGDNPGIYRQSGQDLPAEIVLRDIALMSPPMMRIVDRSTVPAAVTSLDATLFNEEGEHDELDQITEMLTNKFYQVPGLRGTPCRITIKPTTPIDFIEVNEK